MTWRSFIQFTQMRERGGTDATYRGYDLTAHAPKIRAAAERMGIETGSLNEASVVPIVRQQLRAYDIELELETVRLYMHEWFNWDRINKSEVHGFRKRKVLGT